MNYSLLNCRHGLVLAEDRDMISMVLRMYGEWAENSFRLLRPLIPAGGCVVDVGANVGCLTLAFARCVGPQGVVLAFEPQRRVFYNLCANLLINELFWVRAHQCLIGEQEGALELRLGDLDRPYATSLNRGGTSFVNLLQSAGMTAPGSERVPIQSLDAMLTGLAACHLVKVDVEGAEPLVLKGMAETLRSKRPFLYLECGSEQLLALLMPILADFDYEAFWHPALHFNPQNFHHAGNVTGAKGDMNLLCVPRERLGGDQSQVWSRLHPVREWGQVSALFPGFEF